MPLFSGSCTDIDQWSERQIDLGSINVPLGLLVSSDPNLDDLLAVCKQMALDSLKKDVAEVAALTTLNTIFVK